MTDHVIGPKGLLATKARVHVTNSVTFASQHDTLHFMRRGERDTEKRWCIIHEGADMRIGISRHHSRVRHIRERYEQTRV